MAGTADFVDETAEMVCLTLVCHPDTPCNAVESIKIQLFDVSPEAFHLRYLVTGDVHAIAWPEEAAPVRADGLWQHSCFEAFVRPSGGTPYLEYNFSPSGAWAAYQFDSYREGMTDLPLEKPDIWLDAGADWVAVEVRWQGTAPVPADINLTAVIEATDGTKSYWALKHPDGPPDFHDPSCFILERKAPDAA